MSRYLRWIAASAVFVVFLTFAQAAQHDGDYVYMVAYSALAVFAFIIFWRLP